jgi:predicted HicB family RNase H-like nuclease
VAFGSIASEPVDSMDKNETLNFRVSAEFKRRLAEEARKERRSLTNYLETTLTKLWEERELNMGKKRAPKKT